MVLAAAVLVAIGALLLTLFIRDKDLRAPEPVSPTAHLEERKAQIYENLRDLQFEYRLGKLSDDDYLKTKHDLQAELAKVLGEIEAIVSVSPIKPQPAPDSNACPHCGAKFDKPLKFCGECGQPMRGSA